MNLSALTLETTMGCTTRAVHGRDRLLFGTNEATAPTSLHHSATTTRQVQNVETTGALLNAVRLAPSERNWS